jgi:hypothetical protein
MSITNILLIIGICIMVVGVTVQLVSVIKGVWDSSDEKRDKGKMSRP